MGSLNSSLLNNDKDVVIKDDKKITNPYERYNEIDKYNYMVKEYWRNMINSFSNTSKK
jgi:hypothetical protein